MTRETAMGMVREMWEGAEKRMHPLPASGYLFWIAQGVSMGVAIGVLNLYELAQPFWSEMYSLHQQLQAQFIEKYSV